MLLTPELAAHWLATLVEVPDHIKVERYAAAMRGGEWCGSPSPMAFSDHGVLQDGVHRCFAVILTGVPIEVEVKGLPVVGTSTRRSWLRRIHRRRRGAP
jgi:hypothetical protein